MRSLDHLLRSKTASGSERIKPKLIVERPTDGPYIFKFNQNFAGSKMFEAQRKRTEALCTAIANEMLQIEEILEMAFIENQLPLQIGEVIYMKPGFFLGLRLRWILWRKRKGQK
ncbi:hypothetical protein LCGC14_1200860 [marine sediment metagenome]|uniref:Uncharacterized protein n=1 Tax=marine sediment metagenome TaxID=412755 RepID=A0A0F9NZB0_9ZZZZ